MQFNSSNFINLNKIDSFLSAKEVDASMVQEDLVLAKKGANNKGIEVALTNLDNFAKKMEKDGVLSDVLKGKIIKAREKLLGLAPKKETTQPSIESTAKKSVAAESSKDAYKAILRKHYAFSERPLELISGTFAIIPGEKENPDEYFLHYWLTDEPSAQKVKITVTNEGFKLPYSNTCLKTMPEVFEFLKKRDIEIDPKVMLAAKTAAKVVAIRKGIEDRKKVVFPDQILPFLKTHLPNYSDPAGKKLAVVLCKEINRMSLDPEKFKGKSVEFAPSIGMPPVFIGQKLREDVSNKEGKVIAKAGDLYDENMLKMFLEEGVKLNHRFHLQMNKKGKNIKLTILPTEQPIAAGGYKEAFKQHSFDIPLKLEKAPAALSAKRVRKVTHRHEVLQRIIGDAIIAHEGLFKAKEIKKAVEGSSKDLSKFKMTAIPVPFKPSVETSADVAFEQEWYNSDFYSIIKKSAIYDFNGEKIRDITFRDKLDILVDAAESLVTLHEAGYVHRDVKPMNLLVKMNGNKLEGHLHDFDYTQKIGVDKHKGTKFYEEDCARKGFVVPFSDTYALVVSLGVALVPNFSEEASALGGASEEERRKKHVEIVKNHIAARIEADPDLNMLKDLSLGGIERFDVSVLPGPVAAKIKELKSEIRPLFKVLELISNALVRKNEGEAFVSFNGDFRRALLQKNEEAIKAGLGRMNKTLGDLSDTAVLAKLKEIQSDFS